MDTSKMEKIEYDLDPLELDNSNNDDGKNVFMTICENSQESDCEMIAPNNEEIHYELRSTDGILQYRFLHASNNTTAGTVGVNSMITGAGATPSSLTNGNSNTTLSSVGAAAAGIGSTTTIPTTLVGSSCQFFVINEIPQTTTTTTTTTSSRHCLISPKISTDLTNDKQQLLISSSKKRDEKRRATHNEVERRRRDKINQWIFKLRDLLPDNHELEQTTSAIKGKTSTSEYSKGGILIRACEYIRIIKEENESLVECLQENENLRIENATYKEELVRLRKENENLKRLLSSSKNIKIESNNSHLEAS